MVPFSKMGKTWNGKKSQSEDTWVPSVLFSPVASVGVPGGQHISLRPPFPAPPKLSSRSVALISGAHRLRRRALAFRA